MQQVASYIDQIFIFIIFGASINLVLGYTGIIQASPATFGAFGGYSVIYLATMHHVAFPVAVIVGVVIALAVGLVVGLPVLKLEGLWVLLLTLAVGLVVSALLSGLSLFGGDNGLQASSSMTLFGYPMTEPSQVLPVIAVATIIIFLICYRVGESPYGRVLRAIRENESAVDALGKHVFVYKITIFTFTAGLAGFAGAMLSTLTQVANPAQFTFSVSVEVISIMMIGGVGNLLGTVFGAALIVLIVPFLQDVISFNPQVSSNLQLIAYGLALTLVVVFRPKGVIPEGASVWRGLARLASLAQRGRTSRRSAELAGENQADMQPLAPRQRGGLSVLDDGAAPDQAGQLPKIVLEVRGVSKSFSGIKAVDDLSMHLEAGKITALVGPNGAGKTTVFNLLTGALPLDSGTVILDGENITGLRPYQVAQRGMVRTFQDVRLFSRLSVLDNVQLGVPGQVGEHILPLFARSAFARAKELEARETARHWLGFVGLQQVAEARVDSLGYGQQKLVALARILASEARILLLDEPASGVDYQWLDEMLDIIADLRDQGRTVCIVEHNLDVVGRLADHVYFMELGSVTAQGNFSDLISNQRLTEVYFGAA